MADTETLQEFVERAIESAPQFAARLEELGERSPQVQAFADFGIPTQSLVCTSDSEKAELDAYKQRVRHNGSAWMDNTTLHIATTLLSDDGPKYMTPLTVWDLAAFARAVICYDRIYHHASPIDDHAINELLGDEVLQSVPISTEMPAYEFDLGPPDPDDVITSDVITRWMRATFDDGLATISRLASTGNVRDRMELAAVREGWARVLGREDLTTAQLLDAKSLSKRFNSLEVLLPETIVAATSIEGLTSFVDAPPRSVQRIRPRNASDPEVLLADLLSELNLRAYVNLELSNFFGLPYVTPVSRAPFRHHLYERGVAIEDQLAAVGLLEAHYAQLTRNSILHLPVFIAIALPQAKKPRDVWASLRSQRATAKSFRKRRATLDAELARDNAEATAQATMTLGIEAQNLTAALGDAGVAGSISGLTQIAEGNPEAVSVAIQAGAAALQQLVSSSLAKRLRARLRQPHLYYLVNVMDQANRIREALPDFSRIWRIPERDRSEFAVRLRTAGELGGSATG